MNDTCLITGGAGFIGSHLADRLLAAGRSVRVLDNLSPQVHGGSSERPGYLDRDAELVVGDVRDPEAVKRALVGVDSVVHLAAAVGVGQSMYEISHYTAVNNLGTAVLLEALARRPVRRLVVASSMSLYGEGLYRSADGRFCTVGRRDRARLACGLWDWPDPSGSVLEPVATPEDKRPELASVYALSKFDQESLCLMTGAAYGIPTVALRFFNVYGPRQALSNPYTGVLAIFGARLLNGKAPLIFEDGRQRRDFVSVHDVVTACRLALDAAGGVYNIGSGEAIGIATLAQRLALATGRTDLQPEITGRHRVGDIRHCFADISRARTALGYAPRVSLDDGLIEFAEWLSHQHADDRVEQATRELQQRGLTV